MHKFLISCVVVMALSSIAWAQTPAVRPTDTPVPANSKLAAAVSRLMKFDTNGDGALSRDELTDPKLQSLFNRADTNSDESVTLEELTKLTQAEYAMQGGSGSTGQGHGGVSRRPTEILAPRLKDALDLTAEQQMQIAELQKTVDARLKEVLTPEQLQKVKEASQRGPGGLLQRKVISDAPEGGTYNTAYVRRS